MPMHSLSLPSRASRQTSTPGASVGWELEVTWTLGVNVGDEEVLLVVGDPDDMIVGELVATVGISVGDEVGEVVGHPVGTAVG